MLDIGWPELLVVAIVLIIVVGPKDLPPMLRAFGRTTKKLRGMANEFRGQFDEALREAELDDVKKTFDDARKLNPMQSIRDAVNPLKDTANSIRSDIEKTVNAPSETPSWKPKTDIPEATMKLPEGAPEIKAENPASTAPKAESKTASKPAAATDAGGKAAKTAASPSASTTAKAPTKPKAAAAKPAPKAAAPKSAAKAPPKTKAAPAAPAKSAAASTKAPAKAAPRARKTKQGEGQA